MRRPLPLSRLGRACHHVLAAMTVCALADTALAQTNYQQLAFFGPAQGLGVNPQPALVQATNGTLYGITIAGTPVGFGAVFGLRPDAAGRALVRAFGSEANGDTASIASLVLGSDGALYGATEGGGGFGVGTVFRLNLADRRFQVLHGFGSVANDGANLVAAPVFGRDGALYGTAEDGGAYRSGIAFKVQTDGSGYTILHQFGATSTDASVPIAPFIVGADGALYGTTVNGGASNTYAGAVFKLNTDGSGYTVLHSFWFGEGYNPRSALVQGIDGVLYGTTSYGGVYDAGIVYRLNTDGSDYRAIYNFPTTDGGNTGSILLPSGLVQGTDRALYGTTTYGGVTNATATNGLGTVFKLATTGLGYTVLHSFTGEDGRNPQSGVVSGSDGALYGTTPNGGYADAGVVFKLAFSPPSQLVAIDTLVTPAGVQLTYSGPPGQAWGIQATTNLTAAGSWQVLGSATNDSYGLFQFQDAGAAKLPRRFYRTVGQ